MKSNTEINKTIHEKVFNLCWHEIDRKTARCEKCRFFIIHEDDTFPDYENNIKLAWRVVEKMMSLPATQTAAIQAVNVKFRVFFKQSDIVYCDSKEAARLICEMALKVYKDAENQK